MQAPNYYYGLHIDHSKNNASYAANQVKNGLEHTIIDCVSTKFYYGRTFCKDGLITPFMRSVENIPMLEQPTWDEKLKRWTIGKEYETKTERTS
jgi:hypothetical protein